MQIQTILENLNKMGKYGKKVCRNGKSAYLKEFCPDTISLFSFAEKHHLKTKNGFLSDDGLIITHLTDFLPSAGGYIDTAKSAIGGVRDSVHFAVNHGVKSHIISWDNKKMAILIPMKSALKSGVNHFFGGIAGDFYSKGRVKISKGAVILRFNEKLPKGVYRVRNASAINEFKRLKGVKLIETNGDNMKLFTDDVIKKLGYELKDTSSPWTWGNEALESSLQEFNLFNLWQKAKGMTPAMHTYTPNAKIEQLIQNVMVRAESMNEWTYVKDGVTLVDSKNQLLKLLDEIQKFAKQTKYPLDFDIKTIKQIIADSKTPQDAVKKFNEKMGIKASMTPADKVVEFNELDRGAQETGLFAQIVQLIGGNQGMSITQDAFLRHLQKASKTTTNHLEDGAGKFWNIIVEFGKKLGVE